MKELIDGLKKEHELLFETLDNCKKLGIANKDGQDYLKEAKKLFLDHLQREDRELYPVLFNEASKSKYLEDSLRIFADKMQEISVFVSEFFDKYLNDSNKLGIDFAKDYGTLVALLKERMSNEENILYEEYLKISN